MTMTMTQPRLPRPRAYGLVLFLGAAMSTFLFSFDSSIAIYTGSAFRRSLSGQSDAGSLSPLRDAERYSHLQAPRDVDASVEARAQRKAGQACGRMLLYLPDVFADHGHGSQANTYLMGVTTATYLDRAMVLVEPPLAGGTYAGGSQFGCPVDAFRETMTKTSGRRGQEAAWHVAEAFPRGLSRLIRHPAWLSRGCPMPCAATHGFQEWLELSRAPGADEVMCANADGTETNVVVVAGSKLRQFFRTFEAQMTSERPSPQAARWARNLGATRREAEIFSQIQEPRQVWDYVLGLLNKAGFLQVQPWIARDVALFLKSFALPFHDAYDAIHVRRGDKLVKEAHQQVLQYWRAHGHTDADNLPTNYVPFAHYLSQWDDKCPVDDQGEVQVMPHNVYVATDDPVVVRAEIAALPHHVDERTVLWNGCHRLTFFFNPTEDSAFHLNGDGEEGFAEGHEVEGGDSCFARYRRNVVSVADMLLLAQARTFVGEYNSNWGRLIRTLRVRLTAPREDGGGAEGGKGVQGKRGPNAGGLTRTLDTRVAWGTQVVKPPGY